MSEWCYTWYIHGMCLRTNEPQNNSEDLTGKGRQGYRMFGIYLGWLQQHRNYHSCCPNYICCYRISKDIGDWKWCLNVTLLGWWECNMKTHEVTDMFPDWGCKTLCILWITSDSSWSKQPWSVIRKLFFTDPKSHKWVYSGNRNRKGAVLLTKIAELQSNIVSLTEKLHVFKLNLLSYNGS